MSERTTLPISARDDAPHEHGESPGWSERLSFSFFDEPSGFGGVARLRFLPGAHEADGSIAIFIPEGGFATVLTRAKPERVLETAVGRIRFEQDEAMRSWRIRCKDVALVFTPLGAKERQGAAAQIDLDLSFEAWSPPHGTLARETRADELGFVQVVSSGHFEQAGRVTGRLRLGTRQATIDGTGARDRSWGAENDFARHTASWYAVAFNPGLAFGVRAFTMGEQVRGAGWVWKEDELRSVRNCSIDAHGSVVTLAVRDDRDEVHLVDVEQVASIPLREGDAHVALRSARYRHDGQEAFGLVERIRND